MDDITVNETTTLDENKTVTITSYSEDGSVNSVIRNGGFQYGIIYQTSGTLTVKNIIFNGNNVEAKQAIIVLNSPNASLNIETGSVIEKGNNTLVYANETNPNGDVLGGGVCANMGSIIINDASILNNSSDYGGGIYANIPLNINHSIISHNTSKSNGGGITANTLANIQATEVSYNTTNGAGGGLYTIGNEVKLISVKFTNNNAINNHGGAILATKHLSISGNSVIKDNKAGVGGGGIRFTCNSGGTCYGLNITDTTISNNTAENGGGVEISSSVLKVSSSTISNNIAKEYAGGLHISNVKEAIIEDSIISGNKASYGGGINASAASTGPIFTINNTQIIDNIATGNSGGLRIDRISVNVTGIIISGNKAPHYAGVTCRGTSDVPVKFIFNGNTIRNNIASESSGGFYISGNCTYTRNSGTVCENTPSNSYETSTTCPA